MKLEDITYPRMAVPPLWFIRAKIQAKSPWSKKDADAEAKRVRKYGTEIVHVTKDKDVDRYIYTVWAHTKKV